MVCRLITGFSFVSLCLSTALSTGSVVAADPAGELVKAVVQEPSQWLPEENAATFSKADPRIRVQLMRLDGTAASLAGTPVTVIDPQGKATQLTADSKGVVSLSKVTAGLHAVVVTGASAHVAVPLVLREASDEPSADTLPEDASVIANDAVTTVHLPVMSIDPREVLRVATAFLPPATAAGSLADLNDPLITGGEVGRSHLYHVTLDPSGRMEGRILSLMTPDAPQTSLAGMNVMIYSGNQVVARAITDEQGWFAVQNLRPGTHGLIAAGPAGYAAFAFDADVVDEEVVRGSDAVPSDAQNGNALVRMNQPNVGLPLPVVVIPAPLVPQVVGAIRQGQEPPAVGVAPLAPGFAPVPGGGFAGGAGGGAIGGGGGGLGGAGVGGGLGGAGGLLALGGIGAAVAAAAANDDDDRPIVFPPVATPAEPGPVAP